MSALARIKGMAGRGSIPTVAAATVINIPDDASTVYVSGTTAISTVRTGSPQPGRQVKFIGLTGTRDFQNGSSILLPYLMDLGSGSEVALVESDVLVLIQLNNGAWIRLYNTDN